MSLQDPNQPTYTPPGASYDPVTGAPQPPAGGAVPPYGSAQYPGGPGFVPAPNAPGAPNPMLAALLGAIPGVGAMYNGQFAKGVAHIAVFAVLQSLASHGPDIFGWLVAGWEFYMIIEAYQTARARRDGLPLPDPFSLNNIGERFGFKAHNHPDINNAWSQTVGKMPGAAPIPEQAEAYYARTDAPGTRATYQVDPEGNVSSSTAPPAGSVPPPPPGWGAPDYSGGYVPPAGTYGYPPYGAPQAYGMPPVPPVPPMPPVRRNSLPTGAIWLIGLGIVALLGSMRPFRFLEGEATGGLFLIGLSVFMFLRQNAFFSGFSSDSPMARWQLLRSSRGAGVVFIVGLLTLLQGLHVVRWESSWPILLVFLGVMLLAERVALNNMGSMPFSGPPPAPAPPPSEPPVVETASPTSIVPKYTRTNDNLADRGER